LASGFVFLLANPEFYSHLASGYPHPCSRRIVFCAYSDDEVQFQSSQIYSPDLLQLNMISNKEIALWYHSLYVTDDLCMNACLYVNAAVLVYALECFAVTGMFLHAFDGFNE
jgi:hypothetical protein